MEWHAYYWQNSSQSKEKTYNTDTSTFFESNIGSNGIIMGKWPVLMQRSLALLPRGKASVKHCKRDPVSQGAAAKWKGKEKEKIKKKNIRPASGTTACPTAPRYRGTWVPFLLRINSPAMRILHLMFAFSWHQPFYSVLPDCTFVISSG